MTYRNDLLRFASDPLTKAEQIDCHNKGDIDTWLISVLPLIIGAADKLYNSSFDSLHHRSFTSRSSSSGIYDELVSAGIEGACSAFRKYDSSKDVKISSYATWFIRGNQWRVLTRFSSVCTISHNRIASAWAENHPALMPAASLSPTGLSFENGKGGGATCLTARDGDDIARTQPEALIVRGVEDSLLVEDLLVEKAVLKLSPEHHIVICCIFGLLGYGKIDVRATAIFMGVSHARVRVLKGEALVQLEKIIGCV